MWRALLLPRERFSRAPQILGREHAAVEAATEVETGEGDVRWVVTGAGYEGLNAVLFSSAATAVDVERVVVPFKSRGVRFLWHLVPTNSDATTEEQLIASGLRFYEEEPGM